MSPIQWISQQYRGCPHSGKTPQQTAAYLDRQGHGHGQGGRGAGGQGGRRAGGQEGREAEGQGPTLRGRASTIDLGTAFQISITSKNIPALDPESGRRTPNDYYFTQSIVSGKLVFWCRYRSNTLCFKEHVRRIFPINDSRDGRSGGNGNIA